MLKEVWARLYQLAHEASDDDNSDPSVACLNKRILSSLQPDKTMVFVLDLMSSGRSPTQIAVPSHRCSRTASVEHALQLLAFTSCMCISRTLPCLYLLVSRIQHVVDLNEGSSFALCAPSLRQGVCTVQQQDLEDDKQPMQCSR